MASGKGTGSAKPNNPSVGCRWFLIICVGVSFSVMELPHAQCHIGNHDGCICKLPLYHAPQSISIGSAFPRAPNTVWATVVLKTTQNSAKPHHPSSVVGDLAMIGKSGCFSSSHLHTERFIGCHESYMCPLPHTENFIGCQRSYMCSYNNTKQTPPQAIDGKLVSHRWYVIAQRLEAMLW